jgi:hypothetical protein
MLTRRTVLPQEWAAQQKALGLSGERPYQQR